MSQYEKTIEDDLDWSLLNQLHSVVLQMSSFCFRTKQICLTVLVGVIGLIVTLSSNKIEDSIFIAGFLIPLLFWLLDSIAYFYQVKLRGIMDNIRERLYKRHSENLVRGTNYEVIENERINQSIYLRIKDSAFNHSMWLYYILIALDLIIWITYQLN